MNTTTLPNAQAYIDLEEKLGAHNYHPLDIVIKEAKGCWVTDVNGNRFLDGLSAYSAVNQGHCHPKILAALQDQAAKVTLTSRAFRNDQLPLLYKDLVDLTGFDMVLPMNTGAEAVETAIKAARKWGYTVKGIAENQAEIIVCQDNFHGRTTTIISMSSEPQYKDGFGPFTPGFVMIPYGDIEALKAAITPNTCAFLVEPIQGEAGINIPPDGFLKQAAELCKAQNVLFVDDEIQTGLGRTGKLFAVDYEDVKPDVIIIGKALSGGYYPVSAVLSRKDVLGVFNPGDHGSTFGGNPLGCAVARAALAVLKEEQLVERSMEKGTAFLQRLRALNSPHIKSVRGKGLMIGIELNTKARPFCEKLWAGGLLCKETHDHVIRFAPPLVVNDDELDFAFERLKTVLEG
ncbi:MAG: ornithine--oxo-acid transaminase [Cyanobacteria bacterium HKST-UBA04]|nr:ornithine--oxo-acid transaminase [Cyanobacteria bacterium HKST-UBA04]MCA9842510.1 ornithine--oxo-acid transaminase [Cyanobacteria bacterium HKST-UBA03]